MKVRGLARLITQHAHITALWYVGITLRLLHSRGLAS